MLLGGCPHHSATNGVAVVCYWSHVLISSGFAERPPSMCGPREWGQVLALKAGLTMLWGFLCRWVC